MARDMGVFIAHLPLYNPDTLFDEAGKLVNDGTRKFLGEFLAAFAAFIETNIA